MGLDVNAFLVALADELKADRMPREMEEYRQTGGWITEYQNTQGFTAQDTVDYKGNSDRHAADPDLKVARAKVAYTNPEYNAYIAQFETSGGNNYKAFNKGSKAYGKYQHLPSTTRMASKALGKSINYLRTEEGQELAQNWLLDENKAELGRRGIEATPLNMYGIHQQGGYLYSKMLRGGELSARDQKLIIENTPASHRGKQGSITEDWMSKYNTSFDRPILSGSEQDERQASSNIGKVEDKRPQDIVGFNQTPQDQFVDNRTTSVGESVIDDRYDWEKTLDQMDEDQGLIDTTLDFVPGAPLVSRGVKTVAPLVGESAKSIAAHGVNKLADSKLNLTPKILGNEGYAGRVGKQSEYNEAVSMLANGDNSYDIYSKTNMVSHNGEIHVPVEDFWNKVDVDIGSDTVPVSSLFKNKSDDVLKEYPELANVDIRVNSKLKPGQGSFISAENSSTGRGIIEVRDITSSTLPHEIQHALQVIDGVPVSQRGASVDDFIGQNVDATNYIEKLSGTELSSRSRDTLEKYFSNNVYGEENLMYVKEELGRSGMSPKDIIGLLHDLSPDKRYARNIGEQQARIAENVADGLHPFTHSPTDYTFDKADEISRKFLDDFDIYKQ